MISSYYFTDGVCKFDFTMNKVKRDNDKIVCGKTGYLNVIQCVKKVFVVILCLWEVILHLRICEDLLKKRITKLTSSILLHVLRVCARIYPSMYCKEQFVQ